MARPRRPPGASGPPLKGIMKHTPPSGSSSSHSEPEAGRGWRWPSWGGTAGAACLALAVFFGARGYLETRVNTPFGGAKVVEKTGLDVPERYWGSYRPGHYFGMKTREPRSPVFGLMWYEPLKLVRSRAGIRHWCDQGDGLPSYGWLRHDGQTFGEQEIRDPPHVLTTSFVKGAGGARGGGWTARVRVEPERGNTTTPVSLIWYAALDEALGPASPESRVWLAGGDSIVGRTPQLGSWKITLVPDAGVAVSTSAAEARAPGLHALKEELQALLRAEARGAGQEIVLSSSREVQEGSDANLVAVQLTARAPFTVDVVYEQERAPAPRLLGREYGAQLDARKAAFDERFESTFKLRERGWPEADVAVARAALSNMLGGIGYMYGAGRVRSPHTAEPVPYWRAPLYTAVPSRSFFPRGFLWDEGFHGLLIGRWSPDIQLDIAAHWFDLLNVEGWIPREQILGAEAAARVPKEFVVQSNAAANPPMFLLQLARLQAWYQWFHTTQRGGAATSYRWRGREDSRRELNPKTLTSGLDDYPRASHPSEDERHVDLRCWMYAAADAMVTIAGALQRDTTKYEATRDALGEEELLNELHWSPASQTYADYGLHTDGVRLARAPRAPHDPSPAPLLREVTAPPRLQFVASAFGYVSLFPMLLKVLKPDSPKLGKILEDLDKPELLWSPYGLRSLSKSAPLYMRRNTEHDPPYWRGQVWLNINYLALSALRHYAAAGGAHAPHAARLHAALRDNVVGNVLAEYRRTGYLWEQYSGEDGRGAGSRPFTGWTALVVLIMAEQH